MAENSAIEWTHHTFNPWRGCTKVSPGCANCYAETLSKRNPSVLGEWGPDGKRIIAAESYWRQPLKWDRDAKEAGQRRRVFCASLADVFEQRPELIEPRMRLFTLIGQTPNLDWLLLTKRPEMAVLHWPLWAGYAAAGAINAGLPVQYPMPNVWLGVSVEDQARADERIPLLLQTPAAVRFLSCEPLLGPVILHKYFAQCESKLSWVIVGGESGGGARVMHPEWARSLRDQCQAAGVPFFFKQWGEWGPGSQMPHLNDDDLINHVCTQVNTPAPHIRTKRGPITATSYSFKVGKKAAGRLLDGREWSEFPVLEVAR